MKLTIKNIITSLLYRFTIIICGFILPKLIISNYGSNVNGLITSIIQFLSYITLLEAGFGPVIKSTLFKPIVKNDKKTIEKILKASEKIFRQIAYIFIAYIIILCITYPYIMKNEFDSIYTISLILIISISTFSEYYFGMTYNIFLNAHQKQYIIHFIQIITLILNTILTIVFIKLGFNIQLVKLGSATLFMIRPILYNLYVKKKYDINLNGVENNYKIKQKWDALAQHVAYIIYHNTDILVLTFFCNIKEVSVYGIYMLIINNIRNLVYSFTCGIDSSFGKIIASKDKKKFVTFYYIISSIIFISALFLIIPFISIYTKGITDANYIRPTFAYIMIISTFILSIKDPYNDLVKVVGHFKQTQKGAWFEAILNLTISICLVFKLGIVGVIIGTLVSTTIRTIEIIYYSSKNILNTTILDFIKRLLLITISFIIIYLIINNISIIKINNYFDFIIYGTLISFISSFVILIIYLINKKLFMKEEKI